MNICEDIEIVVAGGGICGLSTALALRRKGIKSVVLERSEKLRATGSGITILANGWRALDQLGVASKLRQTSFLTQGIRDRWLSRQHEELLSVGEARCVKRSDLIEILANDLPPDTIRFGCQIQSVKSDTITSFPILNLSDGTTIRAKVLIGCDGANSVVAEFLKLKPKKVFASCAVRGFTNYPNGHGLPHELLRIRTGNVLSGTVPVNHKLVFWFLVQQYWDDPIPKDSMFPKDPELMREMFLKRMKNFPSEKIEMVSNCDLSSLSFSHLRYRAPWDILLGRFRRGTVTVAGDAMHVMAPFLGQGGSAGIEDAVVLARCLARNMQQESNDSKLGFGNYNKQKLVEEALDEYVKERRMRLVGLSTQAYLIGSLQDSSSKVVKFLIICLLTLLFRVPFGHTRYNCGSL